MQVATHASLALALLACRAPPRSEAAPPAPPPPPAVAVPDASESGPPAPLLPDVATDWCMEGWRGLDAATCYFLPPGPPPSRLLVYLAGIIPPGGPSPQKEKVQRIVRAAAERAGVAAILPRGRRGIGPADAKDWWAWPTGAADVDALAGPLVEEWARARARLEEALGRRFERAYLGGSSSGAYFLTALALGGAASFDGFVAASGGAAGLRARARPDAGGRPPFYVGWATGDPTNGAPRALAAHLAGAGWPVLARAHPGGHGAREEYLDEALAYFAAHENAVENAVENADGGVSPRP